MSTLHRWLLFLLIFISTLSTWSPTNNQWKILNIFFFDSLAITTSPWHPVFRRRYNNYKVPLLKQNTLDLYPTKLIKQSSSNKTTDLFEAILPNTLERPTYSIGAGQKGVLKMSLKDNFSNTKYLDEHMMLVPLKITTLDIISPSR